jgi:hypothetical protein
MIKFKKGDIVKWSEAAMARSLKTTDLYDRALVLPGEHVVMRDAKDEDISVSIARLHPETKEPGPAFPATRTSLEFIR